MPTTPRIDFGDALELDWNILLPARECDFVFGNPPFIGAKYQSTHQRAQIARLAALGGSGGTLDYVASWFLKGAAYLRQGQDAGKGVRLGFVATNSITQGEQVAQLWPLLFERYGMEIGFAYRTFNWKSDARGAAHVHVVIVGLCPREAQPDAKRLFSSPDRNGVTGETLAPRLSAYLVDASLLSNPYVVVREVPRPINGAPPMIIGSQAIDGGHLILDKDAREQLLAQEPNAAPFVRPFVGAEEMINGKERWILALHEATPAQSRQLPKVRARLEAVREFRLGSARKSTLKLAAIPSLYQVNVLPTSPFLAVPEVSSERRDYVPIAYMEPPTIPSNKLRFIAPANLYLFGVLTSRMHMSWLKGIGGRLKSDYSYSIDVVYHTFPWPDASDAQRAAIEAKAQAVLDERARFPDSTLGDLYDATAMPPDLRRAHSDLDRAIQRLYNPAAPFASDAARLGFLLGRYETMSAPLQALMTTPAPKRRRATARRDGG